MAAAPLCGASGSRGVAAGGVTTAALWKHRLRAHGTGTAEPAGRFQMTPRARQSAILSSR